MAATAAEHEALHRSLTNVPPINQDVLEAMEMVRGQAYGLASALLAHCPASRERSLAVTKLEESVMWAIKSIALNQEGIS